jgi:hypothetical protein
MEREEIEVEIFPDGRVEYRIRGVAGSGCESISALLEQLGRVVESERTAEYYEKNPDEHIHIADGE